MLESKKFALKQNICTIVEKAPLMLKDLMHDDNCALVFHHTSC